MNRTFVIIGSVLLFVALAFLGNYNIQKMHSGGFYRTDSAVSILGDVVYYEEGLYATVTVRELTKEEEVKEHAKALFINGIGQGSTDIKDLRVSLLLAYLPMLINPGAKNALIIGLGTGMTSGHLSQFKKVKTIEIEPKVLGASSHFELFNFNVLENPNHTLIIGDGRNHLLKNEEKFDIIVSEPTSTWQSFSTQLYSKEFLEIVKSRLNEEGLFVNWVPLYSMSPEDFKNFYKTFSSVFPYNVAFANIRPTEEVPIQLNTSELILIGSMSEISISEEIFNSNYNNLPENSRQYLEIINLNSNDKIYNLLIFTSNEMQGYSDNAKLITDNKPILEFSTARNVLKPNSKEVIDDIEKFISG